MNLSTAESRPAAVDDMNHDGGRLGRFVRVLLPVVAIATVIGVVGFVVFASVASGTFAFDFLAYHQAAQRVLAGERLYDPSVQVTGGFGLFYYPPPFVLVMLPFGLVSASTAAWIWLGLSAVMLASAIWLMPVRVNVRWITLLLAGLSWPVAYAFKLGQVGPLLLLLFSIGWRSLDRPAAVGLVGAFGAIVKIQPGIVLAWALLTRRWLAVAIGIGVLVGAAVIATLATGGLSTWADYLALIRNVSDPISTPHNFTPGAIAFQLGAPVSVAAAIQIASTVAVVVAVVWSALRMAPDRSFLVAVIASQLLSPVLWDHYAVALLLPVAWLLERRHWWAVAIPMMTSVIALPLGLPAALHPLAFVATLLGMLLVRDQGTGARAPTHREILDETGTRTTTSVAAIPMPSGVADASSRNRRRVALPGERPRMRSDPGRQARCDRRTPDWRRLAPRAGGLLNRGV